MNLSNVTYVRDPRHQHAAVPLGGFRVVCVYSCDRIRGEGKMQAPGNIPLR